MLQEESVVSISKHRDSLVHSTYRTRDGTMQITCEGTMPTENETVHSSTHIADASQTVQTSYGPIYSQPASPSSLVETAGHSQNMQASNRRIHQMINTMNNRAVIGSEGILSEDNNQEHHRAAQIVREGINSDTASNAYLNQQPQLFSQHQKKRAKIRTENVGIRSMIPRNTVRVSDLQQYKGHPSD